MWWMPWRLQAMKDVAACEKLRGAGKRALIRRYPNGETRPLLNRLSCARVTRAQKPFQAKRGCGVLSCARVTRAQKPFQAKRGCGVLSCARVPRAQKPFQAKRGWNATGEAIKQGPHRAEYIGLRGGAWRTETYH